MEGGNVGRKERRREREEREGGEGGRRGREEREGEREGGEGEVLTRISSFTAHRNPRIASNSSSAKYRSTTVEKQQQNQSIVPPSGTMYTAHNHIKATQLGITTGDDSLDIKDFLIWYFSSILSFGLIADDGLQGRSYEVH